MIILLLLSLLHMFFIPGILFFSLIKKEILKFVDKKVIFFHVILCSLTINYITGLILNLTNSVSQKNIFIIMAIEFLLILFTSKNLIINTLQNSNIHFRYKVSSDNLNGISSYLSLIVKLFYYSLSFVLILKIVTLTGTNFSTWDATASWNPWAVSWFHGRWPTTTCHYPQLMPINWSLLYLIIGHEIQIPAKISSLLLFLMMFFSPLAFKEVFKNQMHRHLFSIINFILFYRLTDPAAMTDGYMEVPVSFFVLISYFTFMIFVKRRANLLLVQNSTYSPTKIKMNNLSYFLITSVLIAVASTLVKQAGIFYLLLIMLIFLRKINILTFWQILSLIMLLLIGPVFYYSITEWRILHGINSSEIPWVTGGIYHGVNGIQRLLNAIKLISHGLTLPILVFIVFFFLFGFFEKRKDKMSMYFLSGIIIYFLIWAFFLSYDSRNIAIILPMVAFWSSFGIINFINLYIKNYNINYFFLSKNLRKKLCHLHISPLCKILLILFIICIMINRKSFFPNIISLSEPKEFKK